MTKRKDEHAKVQNKANELSDDALIATIKGGDKIAYQKLVQRYLTKIWRLAMSILHDEQEAEDAVQEVFLTLWQSLEKWDEDGKATFSTWIYRVSFNKCIDIKRKRKPAENTEDVPIVCNEKNGYQNTYQKELSGKVSDILKTLPDTQRLALLLYYYEELSVEEISYKLEKTEQSVRSLLKRGRATLKEKIQYDPAFQSWDVSGSLGHLWR